MHRKENSIVPRIACALVATMVTLTLSAALPNSRPKLVVGVMVDGLSMEQLELLRSTFGPDGFNRLLRDGVTIDNLDYGTSLDRTAATAVIFTGASPSVNGVDCSTKFDADKKLPVSVFIDPTCKGVFSTETLSPGSLLVSTISDEVRIDGDGLGVVHSVALDPQQALVMSGHAGNSAFWFNDNTGSWATTTYYRDMPAAIQKRNHFVSVASRIDTMAWTPAMSLDRYPDLPAHRKQYPFRHTFPRKDNNRFKAFKQSALANREVTDIAADYITSISLGNHEAMDMLNLTYTLSPYHYTGDGDWRIQRMDSYVRLDKDLARLFRAIDRGPGMDNTLLFIAGTPAPSRTRRDDERWNIPHGEFSHRRAISLLNMFLMAKYGNGDWVSGYKDCQFYLNRTLVKQRGNDLSEMRNEAAGFLAQMAGVTSTLTLDDIIAHRGGEAAEALRRNVAVSTAGDVFIALAPGWEVTDGGLQNVRLVERSTAATAPAFIMAPATAPQRIDTPVDARVIAPTVAGLLRIRSPNGAQLPPVRLARK